MSLVQEKDVLPCSSELVGAGGKELTKGYMANSRVSGSWPENGNSNHYDFLSS